MLVEGVQFFAELLCSFNDPVRVGSTFAIGSSMPVNQKWPKPLPPSTTLWIVSVFCFQISAICFLQYFPVCLVW